jgi:hypothetical protein
MIILVTVMHINKIQWVDLTFILLFTLLHIDGFSEILAIDVYMALSLYFIARLIHILRTKTSFTWLSFACFIINAIVALCPLILVLYILIIPHIQMPTGIGFNRLFFTFEFGMFYSIFVAILTIITLTKIKKYSSENNNKIISFGNVSSLTKVEIVFDSVFLVLFFLLRGIMEEEINFKTSIYWLSILFAFLVINIIKNIIVLIRHKNEFSDHNLSCNVFILFLNCYSCDLLIKYSKNEGYYKNFELFMEIILFTSIIAILTSMVVVIYKRLSKYQSITTAKKSRLFKIRRKS